MNFILRVFSERVRCRVEHEKIKFISTSGHVIFCLLHKHTADDVFDDFPKISDHFPKIFQIVPKVLKANVSERFSDIFRRLPKISENFRGGTDDVSIIQQHILALLKGLRNHSNVDHFSNYGNTNILTSER